MKDALAIERLGALAQQTRLKALRYLLGAYPDVMSAGQLAVRCKAPHNTMSTHLAQLVRSGLVDVERAGRTMNYRADIAAYRRVLTFLADDCCGGRPDLCGDVARLVPKDDP